MLDIAGLTKGEADELKLLRSLQGDSQRWLSADEFSRITELSKKAYEAARSRAIIDYLVESGFKWEGMPFIDTNEEVGNFANSMPCYAKLIINKMGGNYGAMELYTCVDGDFVKRFQYYGDESADIRIIGRYNNIDELVKLIGSVS